MFVPKKNGSLHICVDYRLLNVVTVRGSCAISYMDKCIDMLGEKQIFSALNENSGYWQIEMDNIDIDNTALVTHHGLFKYSRVPVGL